MNVMQIVPQVYPQRQVLVVKRVALRVYIMAAKEKKADTTVVLRGVRLSAQSTLTYLTSFDRRTKM